MKKMAFLIIVLVLFSPSIIFADPLVFDHYDIEGNTHLRVTKRCCVIITTSDGDKITSSLSFNLKKGDSVKLYKNQAYHFCDGSQSTSDKKGEKIDGPVGEGYRIRRTFRVEARPSGSDPPKTSYYTVTNIQIN